MDITTVDNKELVDSLVKLCNLAHDMVSKNESVDIQLQNQIDIVYTELMRRLDGRDLPIINEDTPPKSKLSVKGTGKAILKYIKLNK